MCGLCGAFNQRLDWVDRSDTDRPLRLRMARLKFLAPVLAAYRCRLTDWQGSAYLLSNGTGRTEVVYDLGQVWAAVEALTGQKPDPLRLGKVDGRVRLRPLSGPSSDAPR